MEVKSDIDWVVGVIRSGKDFKEYGDPYEFSCTIIRRGNEAEMEGGSGIMTPSIWKSIRNKLLDSGIEKVTWDRRTELERSVEFIKEIDNSYDT